MRQLVKFHLGVSYNYHNRAGYNNVGEVTLHTHRICSYSTKSSVHIFISFKKSNQCYINIIMLSCLLLCDLFIIMVHHTLPILKCIVVLVKVLFLVVFVFACHEQEFDWLVLLQRVLGESLLVVRKIENVQTGPNSRPKLACVITECGEMWLLHYQRGRWLYEITGEQISKKKIVWLWTWNVGSLINLPDFYY